jgi:arsenite-transporting ATPase
VAVFHAFSRIVSEGRSAFVVLDTAPTGHSMLLMDATGAYHRQMTREFEGHGAARIVTPLMRLQDAAYTKIILVTLPEVTPVSQAAALQEDLRRASIEPYAWVLNKSVLAAGTRDPQTCWPRGWQASASRWSAWPRACFGQAATRSPRPSG